MHNGPSRRLEHLDQALAVEEVEIRVMGLMTHAVRKD